jgi:hypothetical protein
LQTINSDRRQTNGRLRPAALLSFLAAACVLLFAPADGHAQTVITGRVLVDGEEAAIPGATVEARDEFGRVRGRAVTDAVGEFRIELRLIQGTWMHLHVQRIGFTSATSPRFRFVPDETVHTELRLLVEAVLMAPLTVVARSSRMRAPGIEEFDFRRQRGLAGHFITRQQIEERNPFYLSDLLGSVPGVRLGPSQGAGGRMVYIGRALPGEGACPPQVFLDGRLMNGRVLTTIGTDASGNSIASYRTQPGVRIDDFVSVQSVAGVEVYSGLAGVPAEFFTPDARCGIIAIWTRTT